MEMLSSVLFSQAKSESSGMHRPQQAKPIAKNMRVSEEFLHQPLLASALRKPALRPPLRAPLHGPPEGPALPVHTALPLLPWLLPPLACHLLHRSRFRQQGLGHPYGAPGRCRHRGRALRRPVQSPRRHGLLLHAARMLLAAAPRCRSPQQQLRRAQVRWLQKSERRLREN